MLVNRIVTPRSFVVLGLILSEGGQETMYFVIILSHDYYFSEGGVMPKSQDPQNTTRSRIRCKTQEGLFDTSSSPG